MKLYEIKGPGDYWRGDESNPRSPDYDPQSGRKPSRLPSSRGGPTDDEVGEDKYMLGVQKGIAARKAATRYIEQTGTTGGKRYNLIVLINMDGDSQRSRMAADKWIDGHRDIYTTVIARTDSADTGDSYIYVDATPQSLLWNAVKYQNK